MTVERTLSVELELSSLQLPTHEQPTDKDKHFAELIFWLQWKSLCRPASRRDVMEPFVNHYETLGVGFEATPSEIKKAYKKLAKVHHPGLTAPFALTGVDQHCVAQIRKLAREGRRTRRTDYHGRVSRMISSDCRRHTR